MSLIILKRSPIMSAWTEVDVQKELIWLSEIKEYRLLFITFLFRNIFWNEVKNKNYTSLNIIITRVFRACPHNWPAKKVFQAIKSILMSSTTAKSPKQYSFFHVIWLEFANVDIRVLIITGKNIKWMKRQVSQINR